MSNKLGEYRDRTHDGSLKWAFPSPWLPEYVTERPLPLWIADMDFQSPPTVTQALHKLADHGIFGYTDAPDSLREALASWLLKHHNWSVLPAWMLHSPGIVSALNLAVQTFSQPGDGVMMVMPVYGPFHHCAHANGRRVVGVELDLDAQGHYTLDMQKFEAAIKDNVRIFILCNPHNPIGKVWSKEELTAIGQCCLKHNVLVIADEIHQDLVLSEARRYIPFASLDNDFLENCLVCTAPSKTFNLAGLQTSTLIIANPLLRNALSRQYYRCGLERPNLAGIVACEAAYRGGEEWLGSLLNYLRDNRRLLCQTINALPGLNVIPADALYLAWIDCRQLYQDDLQAFFLKKANVWIEPGDHFGKGGDGFIRLNYGCHQDFLVQSLSQLATALQ